MDDSRTPVQARIGYGQFCPVAMAAEILCAPWTIVLVRELCCGSTRLEELELGLGHMPAELIPLRLAELEEAGIVEAAADPATGEPRYRLTRAGRDLEPVIFALGTWGHRWIDARRSLDNLDPALLMWEMCRELRVDALPRPDAVIHFDFPEQPEGRRRWWMVIEGRRARLERRDEGRPIDLRIVTGLYTLTAIWMGITSLAEERSARRLDLIGDAPLAETIDAWLALSPFIGAATLAGR